MWIGIEERIEGGFLLRCSDDFPKTGAVRFEFYSTRETGELLMLHRVYTRAKLAAVIRLDDWWDWVYVGFDTFESPLNPLRAEHVEECRARPEVWLKEQLLEVGGLGRGVFSLKQVEEKRSRWMIGDEALTQKPWIEEESGNLIPLRKSSDSEHGRVKWYRKLARAGELPPVFALRHDGLVSSLIIDGHDRLLAARLEGIFPEIWEISRVHLEDYAYPEDVRALIEANLARELEKERRGPRQRERVDAINQRLMELYACESLLHRPQVGVIPGGLGTWHADVSRLGLPAIFRGDIA
jgi:hypothetical protein